MNFTEAVRLLKADGQNFTVRKGKEEERVFLNDDSGRLKTNSWLCAPSDENILFKTPYQNRWEHAIHRLGINSNNMSDEIGHA